MARIVWLASYPRSGNTWLRFLLANLLSKKIVHSSQVQEIIPDIHASVLDRVLHASGLRLIKTHWAWSARLPLREDTIGVVYIMRNPIDVMVSSLNYQLLVAAKPQVLEDPEARRRFAEAWIGEYIALGGDRLWNKHGHGTWERNVRNWTRTTLPYPRLVLRYEDLERDTVRHVGRLCRFLNLERTAGELAEAVDRSSFEALRALEEREIRERREGLFYEARMALAHAQGIRFISRGEAGTGAMALSAAQRSAAIDRFGAAMREFGYPVPEI